MNSRRLTLTPNAVHQLDAVPRVYRPAVREHVTRIAANYATCSRPASMPYSPTARVSGLVIRRGDGGATLEVVFRVEVVGDAIEVRAVVFHEFDVLPGWITDPAGWNNVGPVWPVVDI